MKLRFYTICKVASSLVLLLAFSFHMSANTAVQVEGGTITTSDNTTVCTSDDVADIVNFSVTGADGPHHLWVVTDASGNILATQASSAIELTNAPAGECIVYHMAFKAFVFPPLAGVNVGSLVGWYALSNGITVIREDDCSGDVTDGNNGDGDDDDVCGAAGGTISGGPFTFCVGDGVADNIHDGGVVLAGNTGSSAWVVTDESASTILGLPPTPQAVDFDGAGVATCLLWHLSYEGELSGAEAGGPVSALSGCFSLSNSITVYREDCSENGGVVEEECATVSGGTLSGGPFTFCVGDGVADNIHANGVVLTGNTGSSAWVVTDESASTILGLPPTPQAVDFDGAGVATCLLWHLSYTGELSGAEAGGPVSGLSGCFSLSNSVTVFREDCSPTGNENTAPNTDGDAVGDSCGVNSGSISLCDGSGTNINVCTSDGVDSSFDVCVTDNEGDSFWVIIDANRNLIAQQDGNSFDFEGVPAGLCIICHVSYEGEISGLEPGLPVDDVVGCVDFSNEVSVTRFVDDPAYCFGLNVDEPELSFQTIGNPVDDLLRLQIKSEFAGQNRVIIYDIVGRTLFNNTISLKEGTTTIDIDATDFDPGIHFINVNNGQKSVMDSFVKGGR